VFGSAALGRGESRYAEGTNGMNANDPIYLELVDFVAGGTTPQDVVNFRPRPKLSRV